MSASHSPVPNSALETATDLASRGYPVLPVFPNSKIPALVDWPNKATTNLAQIRRWFSEGSSYLVGMVTGPRSGVDVIDVDPRHGGDRWLAEHEYLIPSTRRQTTRRGGYHFFFKHHPGLHCSESRIAPGIDVRAAGGYVIVWAFAGLPLVDVAVADWPTELLQIVIAASGRSPGSSGGGVELQRRLPPSATHLVETLSRMPNPLETSRSVYIEVMLAAQGCITALEQAGTLTDEDRNNIADAAIAWAERWEGYQGTDEREKWESDWSQNGGDLAGWQTLERIVGQLIPGYREERARAEFESDPVAYDEESPPERPTIQISGAAYVANAVAAERAIMEAGLPVFRRAQDSQLVRPLLVDDEASDDRRTTSAALVPITDSILRQYMQEAARWHKYDARAKKWKETAPPADTAALILARAGYWPFPAIAGVIATPTMRADGSILQIAGYDPASRLFLINPPPMPDIPEHPSRDDALQALEVLKDLLSGFPFVGDADRSVALSACITPVVRAAMPVAPMHVVTAPKGGTGKSYLLDVASVIATGELCPVLSVGGNPDECEKRLCAAALQGKPIIGLDNVTGGLRGDFFCQLIERPVIRPRQLGVSELHTIENTFTVLGNGNNIEITRDMTRRVLRCELDANMERPEDRQFASDPVAMIQANRGTYVAACLTIVRAYLVAESPNRLPRLASFERWSDRVRSALVWLGCADPLDTVMDVCEDDPEAAQTAAVLEAWPAEQTLSAGDLIAAAMAVGQEGGPAWPGWLDALRLVAADNRGVLDATRLGTWLRDHKNVVTGGIKLVRTGSRTRPRWSAKKV